MSGTVKFFDDVKGFGFITPDDGGPDLYVHATTVAHCGLGTLEEGQRLTFDVGEGRNGKPRAERLRAGE